MELRQVADELWSLESAVPLLGMRMPVRSAVIRLGSGRLVIFSPVSGIESFKPQLEALGPVQALVAPTLLHHLGVGEAHRVFPLARLFARPWLQNRRRDLPWSDTLGEAADPLWAADIEQQFVEGAPKFEETLFFHLRSRTLVLFDLCFNLHHLNGWIGPLLMRLNGAYGRFGPSRLGRRVIEDRLALRRTIDRVLAWKPERVLVGHGEVLAENVGPAIERAFEFLPRLA